MEFYIFSILEPDETYNEKTYEVVIRSGSLETTILCSEEDLVKLEETLKTRFQVL